MVKTCSSSLTGLCSAQLINGMTLQSFGNTSLRNFLCSLEDERDHEEALGQQRFEECGPEVVLFLKDKVDVHEIIQALLDLFVLLVMDGCHLKGP